MLLQLETYLPGLKKAFETYSPISERSWLMVKSAIELQTLDKGETLLRAGQLAKHIHYICKGALRAYYTDELGNSYNKNLFLEGQFAASKVSLLRNAPSYFTLEALEDSILLNINFLRFRKLIDENSDIKSFYIAYIEKNWIIDKEQREISLVMENATQRYLSLLEKYPGIENRIPQQHIASHLGVTPTQLSRIRKALKKQLNQPM